EAQVNADAGDVVAGGRGFNHNAAVGQPLFNIAVAESHDLLPVVLNLKTLWLPGRGTGREFTLTLLPGPEFHLLFQYIQRHAALAEQSGVEVRQIKAAAEAVLHGTADRP